MRYLATAVALLLFVTGALAQIPPRPYIPPAPILNPSSPFVGRPPIPISPPSYPGSYLVSFMSGISATAPGHDRLRARKVRLTPASHGLRALRQGATSTVLSCVTLL